MTLSRQLAIALLPWITISVTTAAEPEAQTPFGQLSLDYKKPADVPSTLFNPFKVQIVQREDGHGPTAVSDEAICAALTQRGLSGLLLAATDSENRAIIGSEVFAIGDELQFSDDNGATKPLVANATVTLRGISKQSLFLELNAGGDSPRTIKFSLRSFLAP